MNISDINTTNLSSTQCIAIVNKGIKIGELKVTTELGYDFHFGKEFVGKYIIERYIISLDRFIFCQIFNNQIISSDAVSRKENFPILKKKSLMNSNGSKYKSATGTHSSKSNCKVSSVSTKQIDCLISNSNKDIIITKDTIEQRKQSLDNKKIDTSNPENDTKDKVALNNIDRELTPNECCNIYIKCY